MHRLFMGIYASVATDCLLLLSLHYPPFFGLTNFLEEIYLYCKA